MAVDWAANVKQYVADADDEVIAGIVRYCGIALQKRDSSLVSFTDPKETDRVRENFLKKKLALTEPDSVLDEAIAAVGQVMKGENFKNRVTVYYLLADRFGLTELFRKKGKAAKAGAASAGSGASSGAAAAGAGTAALGLAGLAGAGSGDASAAPPAAAPVVEPAPEPEPEPESAPAASVAAAAGGAALAGAAASSAAQTLAGSPASPEAASATRTAAAASAPAGEDEGGGFPGWLLWLLLGLLLLGLLWWLFFRDKGDADGAAAPSDAAVAASASATPSAAVSGTVDLAAAPAEGTATIPAGAGVTSEMRDGKPVVKVYFDTGATTVTPAFAATAAGLKAYLASHAGASLAISGYNDASGNADANAELSKSRAQAVQAALVAAGIPETSAALVKPENTTDTTVAPEAARRVEVTVVN